MAFPIHRWIRCAAVKKSSSSKITAPKIIAGLRRGAYLHTPALSTPTRPTSGRSRASLFDVLLHAPDLHGLGGAGKNRLTGLKIADLCAGSGALGLEALSRGAQSALFVDQQATACTAIRQNLSKLAFQDFAQIKKADYRQLIPPARYDLVFLDPPYGLLPPDDLIKPILDKPWLEPNGLLVLQIGPLSDQTQIFANSPDPGFHLLRCHQTSDAVFCFIARPNEYRQDENIA